jgi:phage major head subunit gpT-like protein
MPQISENFQSLVDLDPLLTDIFFQHYTQTFGYGTTLFNVQSSGKSKETDQRVGSFRDPRPFRGQVEYQTVRDDYQVVYEPEEYADGFIVERKMFDDMQYAGIFDRAANMGTSFARFREKDMASVLNLAFSGATGYDGKTLCASDHPRSKTDSTAVSNTATLALNVENLNTVMTLHRNIGDDLGEQITVMPTLLVVPEGLRKTGTEITGSVLTPENANNAVNVFNGMQTLVWPYLTDQDAWFIVDVAMARRYLKWYDRIPVEFAAEQSFDTMQRKYRGYMRYAFGWSDFRWVYGSNPD